MAAVPISLAVMVYPKDKSGDPYPATIVGYAWITGLSVGGGPSPGGGGERPAHPIVLPPPGGLPPTIWPSPGHPAHPIAPGGPPPRPEHPIFIPPDMPEVPDIPTIPSEPKPPPPEGGWGWHPDYGWGYFPPPGTAGPKK